MYWTIWTATGLAATILVSWNDSTAEFCSLFHVQLFQDYINTPKYNVGSYFELVRIDTTGICPLEVRTPLGRACVFATLAASAAARCAQVHRVQVASFQ